MRADAVDELVTYVTTADNWWGQGGIAVRLGNHARVSFLALLAGAAAAIPPAMWLGHINRAGTLANAIANLGRAIPSLAIIVILLKVSLDAGYGLGFWPTFGAMFLLALPPIFTNTYAGIRGVDPAVVESARGMGMRPRDVVLRVELPNALPLMLTGLRVSAVQVVATATLGAYVGFAGLGSFINEGFRQQDDGKLLTGAVLVAILAIVTELIFGLAQRGLTPWIPRKDHP